MKIIFFITVFFSSCSTHSGKFKHIELVIEDAKSYKYDFKRETYTIFFIDKPPIEIKFKLSDEERIGINEKYYELHLDRFSEKISIEGNCNIMPQIYTTVSIIRDSAVQEIRIETGCNDFSIFKKGKAKDINNFLKYIFEILNSKTEIKNAPKSNIHYM